MKQVSVVVFGRVQGVGYRYFVRDQAGYLGVSGIVRNNPDGTVSITAVGEEPVLREFLARIRAEGDRFIQVARMEVEWNDAGSSFQNFEIRR